MTIRNFDVYLIKFVNEHLISYQIKTISITAWNFSFSMPYIQQDVIARLIINALKKIYKPKLHRHISHGSFPLILQT